MLMAQYLAFSSSFFAKSWKVWHQSKFDQMKSDLRQLCIIGKIVWQALTWYANSQKQDNIETHSHSSNSQKSKKFYVQPCLKEKTIKSDFWTIPQL